MAELEWGTGQPGAPLASSRSGAVAEAARLLQPKHRRTSGLFLAEGPQAAQAVLGEPGMALRLFVTPAAGADHAALVAAAHSQALTVTWCEDSAIARLTTASTPAGVVAVARMRPAALADALQGARLAVALWQANDPGNVGTIIRTTDAVAADAVVLSPGSVDPYNDKCVRSTAGSIAHVPVVTGADFAEVVERARAEGMRVIATAVHGERLDAPHMRSSLAGPVLWVFGSEAHGLPEDVLAEADAVVAVPMFGRAESLNLAVAAGVCMYASAMAQRSANT